MISSNAILFKKKSKTKSIEQKEKKVEIKTNKPKNKEDALVWSSKKLAGPDRIESIEQPRKKDGDYIC